MANASSSKSSLRPGCSDSLFQNECREEPNFLQQVSALERMLRVKTRKDEAAGGAAATVGASAEIVRLREVHNLDGLDGATLAGVAVGGISGLLLSSKAGSAVSADESAVGAAATAGASAGIVELRKVLRPERLDGAKFAGAAVGGNSGLPMVPELGCAVCAGASMPEARVALQVIVQETLVCLRLLSLHVPLCVTGHLLHVHARMVMSLVLLLHLSLCLLLLVLLPCLCAVHSRMLVLLRMHVGRWQEVTIRGRTRHLIRCGCRIHAEK